MPDHLHWLLDGSEELSDVVGRFKSFAGHALWKAGCAARGSRIWQRSYWDRFVRDTESLEATIDYILANPVRAGLITEPRAYPWSVALWEKVEQI
jgi:REP element-mobilizing transposase RayT